MPKTQHFKKKKKPLHFVTKKYWEIFGNFFSIVKFKMRLISPIFLVIHQILIAKNWKK